MIELYWVRLLRVQYNLTGIPGFDAKPNATVHGFRQRKLGRATGG